MNTKSRWPALLVAAALSAFIAHPPCPAVAGEPAGQPAIESIEITGADVVVTVRVPAGIRKVSLESRARLGRGAWVPRAVERVDGEGGTVQFRLPKSAEIEILRVRADASEPLPASFYEGQKQFEGPASTSPTSTLVRLGNDAQGVGDGAVAPGAAEGGDGRAVVESDIWRLRGDVLYFFNTYRGLQVIDLSTPDAPQLRGTLALPAAGEQLYVIQDAAGADRVVLLARDGCAWDAAGQSQVIVIDPQGKESPAATAAAAPRVLASVAVPGYIAESRLVGSALYVASQSYRRVQSPPGTPDGESVEQWEYGTVISSFDLADPEKPAPRGELWFAGYGNTIAATDRFLFVVTTEGNDWWRSRIQLVDVASPDGAMEVRGIVRPTGRVADKFKLHLNGDVFTVISETSRWADGSRQGSVLETFSLGDSLLPVKLGQVEVGHGESLFATRFDGDRAYIVTFLRIDPLWVVDLSNPAEPKVLGELETPGWSTYIHPLGDRLVTVGVDDQNGWRATVALFDVADPAKPALLDKVFLGEGSSWSEANQDEKAFTVLPEAGLILVPYQGWSQDDYAARVQLIDLERDALTARGVIEHAMQPRRATVHEERLLSISGREMFCVDARDRDNPVVTAELELSWAVDRVVPVGEHLIEVANGYSWSGSPAPELRVVGAGAPDAVLLRQRLSEPLAILSAEVREGVLFVAQGETRWVPVDPAKPDGEYQSLGVVVLSTFDATRLPELPPLGSVKADVASLAWASELQALWPKRGLLVLVGRGQSYWRWGLLADVAGPGVARDMAPGLWWPWWGGGSGRLIAFDVADPVAPKLLSDLDLGTQNQSWGSSEVFLGDGLVFQSHQASEFIEGETLPGQAPPQPYEVVKPDGTRETVTPPVGIWVTKYYLDVVDYADPTTPTVRPPVNLPGSLIGVSRDAALLFTSGQHWDENWRTDGVEYLDVSAYDGVSVALVASLKLPAEWPRASTVVDSTIVLARRPSASETVGVIETWGLATDRTLRKLGELRLDVAAQALQAAGSLLAVQSDREILALDLTRPEALTVVGRGRADGCLWPTLGNARVGEGEALWLPLGEYGIMSVPLATPAGQGD